MISPETTTTLESYFQKFRDNIVGIEQEFTSPFGIRKIIYTDWTASGRLYRPIEEKMVNDFGPFVANTHTETTVSGTAMTMAYHEARHIIKHHVNAGENDILITDGTGMTGVINKFQRILGLKVPENLKAFTTIPQEKRPVVFVSHMEQIAGKYRAGLSMKYLDSYLENGVVEKSIREFLLLNQTRQTNASDFEQILKSNAPKNIDWFFKTIINSRDIIDYKFDDVEKTNDSIRFTVKNKTGTVVPMPVYGLQNGKVVFKNWIDGVQTDSIFSVKRNGADKIVLNYKNEAPEYNLRNNWRSLKDFHFGNRPVKFVFFKDLEDPHYNQILFVPTLTYNLYDGLTPGLRFHNKTVLDKPFTYDINPAYSIKAQSASGSAALSYNQLLRDSRLYHIKYSTTGSYYHYAPDATYLKITPSVQFRIREEDLRDNRKQYVTLREVIVDREETAYVVDGVTDNYAVFNARYSNTKTEVTQHFSVTTDFQASAKFGKTSLEMGYRKLFENNRHLDLRLFAGTFLYNETDDDYFSFALDRPTDYLFDNNYYGRSETSGLFSQQLILTEGGFKSKLDTPYANQWIATVNAGINVWNWVEIYGDAGFVKNRYADAKFLYDSGVRLNLVTDYFELYFPVYSSNGWEFQENYSQRIRFIVTLDPKILVNLFTRKWF